MFQININYLKIFSLSPVIMKTTRKFKHFLLNAEVRSKILQDSSYKDFDKDWSKNFNLCLQTYKKKKMKAYNT